MNLQDTFYIIGIVYMTAYLLLLVVLLGILIKAKKQFEEIKEEAEEKVDEINYFVSRLTRPKWLGLGLTLLPIIFRLIKGRYQRNKRKLFFVHQLMATEVQLLLVSLP